MRDDLISREATIQAICQAECCEPEPCGGECNLMWAVRELPSVEGKKGKWVPDGKGFYACTSCGEPWSHWWAVVVSPDRIYKELRFCPHCGAEMEISEDE